MQPGQIAQTMAVAGTVQHIGQQHGVVIGRQLDLVARQDA
jgi:hypothetical protein